MVFNTTDDFRRMYDSPILNRQSFSNNYMYNNPTGCNLFDKNSYDRDFNRINHLKEGYNCDYSNFNYTSNYDYNSGYNRNNSVNFDRFNTQNEKHNSNSVLNNWNTSNLNANNNYVLSNSGLNSRHRTENLFEKENQFQIPSYLRSVETYTPNRLNGNYTPNRFGSSTNCANNPSTNNYGACNLDNTRYSSGAHKYDTTGSSYLNNNFDEWKRENYLNISNSPNLRFNPQFYPNNNTIFNDNNRYKDMKDHLNYAQNRDKLEMIKKNLNSVSLSDFNNLNNQHTGNYSYDDNFSSRMDNFNNFASNLNGNFNTKFYANSNRGWYNGLDINNNNYNNSSYNNYNPNTTGNYNNSNNYNSSTNRYNAADNYGKFSGLDHCNFDTGYNGLGTSSNNRYVDALERMSPSSAFYRGDIDQLNIDELYDKVKEQKQQLLQLKSNLH